MKVIIDSTNRNDHTVMTCQSCAWWAPANSDEDEAEQHLRAHPTHRVLWVRTQSKLILAFAAFPERETPA